MCVPARRTIQRVRVAEQGRVVAEQHVAIERNLQAAGNARARYRGDRRNAQLLQLPKIGLRSCLRLAAHEAWVGEDWVLEVDAG